jgi:hypothetical protein
MGGRTVSLMQPEWPLRTAGRRVEEANLFIIRAIPPMVKHGRLKVHAVQPSPAQREIELPHPNRRHRVPCAYRVPNVGAPPFLRLSLE